MSLFSSVGCERTSALVFLGQLTTLKAKVMILTVQSGLRSAGTVIRRGFARDKTQFSPEHRDGVPSRPVWQESRLSKTLNAILGGERSSRSLTPTVPGCREWEWRGSAAARRISAREGLTLDRRARGRCTSSCGRRPWQWATGGPATQRDNVSRVVCSRARAARHWNRGGAATEGRGRGRD